jgi:hypothetical protein
MKKPKFELTGNHTRETCKPKKPKNYIYALTSVGKEGRRSTWSFWSSFDKAIKGLNGFESNGKTSYEFYSEQLYYNYLVIEKIALDYPLIGANPSENIWFKFTATKVENYWIKEYGCERCECPKEYKGIVGFHT